MEIGIKTNNNSRIFKMSIDNEVIFTGNPFDMLHTLRKMGIIINPRDIINIKKDVENNHGYFVEYVYEF